MTYYQQQFCITYMVCGFGSVMSSILSKEYWTGSFCRACDSKYFYSTLKNLSFRMYDYDEIAEIVVLYQGISVNNNDPFSLNMTSIPTNLLAKPNGRIMCTMFLHNCFSRYRVGSFLVNPYYANVSWIIKMFPTDKVCKKENTILFSQGRHVPQTVRQHFQQQSSTSLPSHIHHSLKGGFF